MRCDLLDRQGRVRRPARGVLDGLQPEHRHEPGRAHLLDLAAEALDLLHEGLERGARGGDNGHRRRDEISTEQGDMPAFPLHIDRAAARRGLDRAARTVGRLGQLRRPGRKP